MEFKGTIKREFAETSGTSKATGKPWRKKEFIIEDTSERIVQAVRFTVFNDTIDELQKQGLEYGAVGTVSLDFHVHEYNGNFFNDVRGWKWEAAPSWDKVPHNTQLASPNSPVYHPDKEQRPVMPLNDAATQQGQRIPKGTEGSLPFANDLPF